MKLLKIVEILTKIKGKKEIGHKKLASLTLSDGIRDEFIFSVSEIPSLFQIFLVKGN